VRTLVAALAATLSPSEAGQCHQPGGTAPVTAAPVPGSASDWDLTSFDGTTIRVHWFPLAGGARVPTLLMGPGWGSPGDTDTSASDAFGTTSIRDLWAAGYNVLSWDPRGFGKSGGLAQVDSPAYEAKDVSTIVTWLATRPGVQLDRPGDPRVGMVGGSRRPPTAASTPSCPPSPGTRS
jgi:ABC-2 type transport system ATP-binding protein